MYKKNRIPGPTISRLPIYFRCLRDLQDSGITIVSSGVISQSAGVKASQFRKDMSCFGEFGIQGLGYPVNHLLEKIGSIMKLDQDHKIAVVGVGNLGKAFAEYPGFKRWRFHISYLYDKDPEKIGREINGITVDDINALPSHLDVSMCILTVPARYAQEACDSLIKAGVRAILNFTGSHLNVPGNVSVRNVDVTIEAAVLSFYLSTSSD